MKGAAWFVLASLMVPPLATGQSKSPNEPQAAGIWQLIEERNGRVSCWGAVIQLSQLRFPATLEPSSIDVTEAKHNRSVKDLIEWEVDSTRKRLTIRFRPGMGDFRTGNRMEVRIKRQVLDPTSSGPMIWVLETDRL
jgi:hypothetical protein